MKVTDIRIDVVRREFPALALQDGLQPAHPIEQGVLRVFTDEGIEGNCLIGAWIPAEPHFRPILDVIKPELVGREPFEREWLWGRMQFLATCFRLSETSWAPVDVALWDIAGKAAGLPVFKLLGAQRHEVPAYAAYPAAYDTVEGFLGEARETLARGFRAYKIHPGHLASHDVAALAGALRELGRRRLSPSCSTPTAATISAAPSKWDVPSMSTASTGTKIRYGTMTSMRLPSSAGACAPRFR